MSKRKDQGKFLEGNPYELGSRECLKYEKSRHDLSDFSNWEERENSYERVKIALGAWMNRARKNHKKMLDESNHQA